MSLEQKDIELIEHLIYKGNDDVAVAISRSLERLEERLDGAESRLYSRFADIEEKVEGSRQELSDEVGEVKGELRELSRLGEDLEGE